MTVKECYDLFGGDYDDVIARLRKDERVCKYLKLLAESREKDLTDDALARSDFQEAFLHIHNLKGIALNLSLTPLFRASDTLCEALRHGDPGYDVSPLMQDVSDALGNILSASAQLQN